MKKILIVEDHLNIRQTLRDFLIHAGHEVVEENRGDTAFFTWKREQPNLVLLDLNLPGKDGIDICKEIRQHSQVPIIMLTARREEEDHIRGLEIGADDYITKPFSPKVLVLKVQKLLELPKREALPLLRYCDLELQLESHRVFRKHLEKTLPPLEIHLTPVEFNLLRVLAEAPTRSFSRDQLIDLIYDDGVPPDVFDRTIDSHVKNVRKKLSPGHYIQTVRGIGYCGVGK